eukprot:855779-Rhodomonas_salina.6
MQLCVVAYHVSTSVGLRLRVGAYQAFLELAHDLLGHHRQRLSHFLPRHTRAQYRAAHTTRVGVYASVVPHSAYHAHRHSTAYPIVCT